MIINFIYDDKIIKTQEPNPKAIFFYPRIGEKVIMNEGRLYVVEDVAIDYEYSVEQMGRPTKTTLIKIWLN